MGAKYILVSYKFDTLRWAKEIAKIPAKDRKTFGDYIGVNHSTLGTWANLREIDRFPFPSMSAFIAACNALDLKPSDFFVLNNPEDENV